MTPYLLSLTMWGIGAWWFITLVVAEIKFNLPLWVVIPGSCVISGTFFAGLFFFVSPGD